MSAMYDSFDDGSKIGVMVVVKVLLLASQKVSRLLNEGKLIARMYHRCLTQQTMKFTRQSTLILLS